MMQSDQLRKAFTVIRHLEGEVAALKAAQTEPVAILGIACRMPGSAAMSEDALDAFRDLVMQGRSAIVDVPPDRWDAAALYDPDPDRPGRMTTRRGGFIAGVDRFDAGFFNISPREARMMDPQQRLLLELSWHALEHAAIAPDRLSGSDTGVFIGICASDYGRMAAADPDNLDAYWGTGNVPSVAAGRIAYTFGLTGPCMSIDTACSSGLVAIHQAVQSLRRGDCGVALAGAANLVLAPEPTIAFSKARMMSPDGACHTFDERANGYVRSEGAAVLVLKTLSRALADGDRVLAVIRGSAINQDGASGGLTVPNGPAQAALIRDALADAGLEPGAVGYVEAHGTGTALGDPIEIGALADVFGGSHDRDNPLFVGSVKSLVGHLEIAAGMAGLIKLVLALDDGVIPGYPHLGRLNPHIPWDRLPVAVARETRPWPHRSGAASDTPRIAGISSFGFSGTNAHLIVQAAPQTDPSAPAKDRTAAVQPAWLFRLSARSDAALIALAGRHAERIAAAAPGTPEADPDAICTTAAIGRSHLPHRLTLIAADRDDLVAGLRRVAAGGTAGRRGVAPATPPRLAFLFSGQGAQYPGMGRRLHDLHPAFRDAIDEADAALRPWLGTALTDLLWGAASARLSETAITQPALFGLEWALARCWIDWGVEPAFLAGHSVGEYAAACIAGVFSLADGARLIAARGRLMQDLPPGGAMAALPVPADLVRPLLDGCGTVAIAAINAPEQTVVSGEAKAVDALCARLADRHDIRNHTRLDVSHAFHSPLMAPMLDDFRQVAAGIGYALPTRAFVSSLTGQLAMREVATADYWVRHVAEPVRFADAMATLGRLGLGAALEIGPRATLAGLVRACLGDAPAAIASLARDRDDWLSMLDALARLHLAGVPADGARAGRLDQPVPPRADLPLTPFERSRHWLPAPGGRGLPDGRPVLPAAEGGHPLLGHPLPNAAQASGDALYQAILTAHRPALLAGHRVYDGVVLPGAGYVDMALAAARASAPDGRPPCLANLSIQAALVLPPDQPVAVQTVITAEAADRARLRILSTPAEGGAPAVDATWQLHVTGEVAGAAGTAPADIDLAALRARFDSAGSALAVDAFYDRYAAMGLRYAGDFQSVQAVWRRGSGEEGESLARVAVTAPGDHVIHPALLDGCFQALAAAFGGDGRGPAHLPVGIEAVRLFRDVPAEVWSHAVIRPHGRQGDPRVVADLRLFNAAGQVVAAVDGLQAVPVDRRALAFVTAAWKDRLYQPGWVPAPSPAPAAAATAGGWLILADRGGIAAGLAAALEAAGQRVVSIAADAAEGPGADRAAWSGLLAREFGAADRPLGAVLHLGALDLDGSADPDDHARARRLACDTTLALVQALAGTPDRRLPRLFLMTAGSRAVADIGPVGIHQAMLWGFGRSIALELPALDCTCIDLPPADGSGLDDATTAGVVAELLHPSGEPQLAWRQGRRHVARLTRLASLTAGAPLALPDGPFRLRAVEYGSFDRVEARPIDRRPPGPGEVEIEVRAAAINFKDVLYVLGMLKSFSEAAGITRAEDQPLGFECAGRVVRTGPGVEDLSAGDEVFAMAPSAMASHVTVDRRLVHRVPRRPDGRGRIGFAEAAALPTVFMTAIHALERLARIRAGDRVLIHACAGGVGQAALQIALRAGAEVYGTASPAKWPVLKAQGVRHVMHSRTLDFADRIMELTGGRGVDVVLNSLTGDVISRSADVLAPGGRFIEIGKIGIWDRQRMAAYRPDVFYAAFDLGEIDDTGGGLQASLLDEAVAGIEAGHLQPLPVRRFPIGRAEAAFRHLAQARNIGKVVLTVPEPSAVASAAAGLRADRSYLITGGTGALGRLIARRMIADGARHLVLAGRSAGGEDAAALVQSLTEAASDAEIRVWPLDVTDRAAVEALLDRMEAELAPPGGIVHAAGVLDDGIIGRLDPERFDRVLAPKVTGAWNLHRATEGREIDLFVTFSSIAAITGAPGQANYAAANAALNALARLRRSQGLPAVSIAWGPWDADGMAERTRDANQARFAGLGLKRMPAVEAVDAFSHLLQAGPPVVMVADVAWPRFLRGLPGGGAAAFYGLIDRPARDTGSRETGALLARLDAAAPADREALLATALRDEIAAVTGLTEAGEIGPDQPLSGLGIDSLMAVELKNRIEAGLRCTLNPTLLLDHPTLAALSRHLIGQVLGAGGAATTGRGDGAVLAAREGAPAATMGAMEELRLTRGGPALGLCRWQPQVPDGREDTGAGAPPLVICVHGILDQGAIWAPVAERLVAAGCEVIAPDLRGHGVSDHLPPGTSPGVLDFVADLGRVAARRAAGRRYILVGHSVGAAAATLHAATAPDDLAHLVLIEPVTPAMRETHPVRERLETDLRYLTAAPAHPVYPDPDTAARMLALNHPGLPADYARRLAERTTRVVDGGLTWVWDPRLRNPLGPDLMFSVAAWHQLVDGLTMPSTRIHGTTSRFAGGPVLLDPDRSLPLSRSVVIEGGHNLHTDAPAAIAALILATLDSAAG
ncbi:SDR family NAD(P)-dependent oxidoreductase [Tistrella mobilis]|uniref:SDR family NAD(P)-dependent oxidoreductase n=1 Tax=Tistrella mobilis TaxID=171437 RepID=UPI003555FF28